MEKAEQKKGFGQNPETHSQAEVPQGIRQDRSRQDPERARVLRGPCSQDRGRRKRAGAEAGTRGPYLCASGNRSRSSCNKRTHRALQPRAARTLPQSHPGPRPLPVWPNTGAPLPPRTSALTRGHGRRGSDIWVSPNRSRKRRCYT